MKTVKLPFQKTSTFRGLDLVERLYFGRLIGRFWGLFPEQQRDIHSETAKTGNREKSDTNRKAKR